MFDKVENASTTIITWRTRTNTPKAKLSATNSTNAMSANITRGINEHVEQLSIRKFWSQIRCNNINRSMAEPFKRKRITFSALTVTHVCWISNDNDQNVVQFVYKKKKGFSDVSVEDLNTSYSSMMDVKTKKNFSKSWPLTRVLVL